jgi:hypothetical protein
MTRTYDTIQFVAGLRLVYQVGQLCVILNFDDNFDNSLSWSYIHPNHGCMIHASEEFGDIIRCYKEGAF